MRTYEILDENGNVVDRQEMEFTMAPSLLYGQTAKLVAIGGKKLTEIAKAEIGPNAPALPSHLMTQEQAAAIATKE